MQVVEVNRWGRGSIQNITSALDGEMNIIQTPFGAYFYELNPLRLVWFAEDAQGSVLSSDESMVALKFSDGEVRVYELKTGEQIYSFKHEAIIPRYPPPWFSLGGFLSVISMLFSPTDDLLAVGYGDNQIEVWNIEDGKSSALLANDIAPFPWVLVFSSDGRLLASSDSDVIIWSLENQKPIIRIPKAGSISQRAFSPDSSLLVSSSVLSILVWGVPNGNLVYNYGVGNYISSVAFSDDGRQLEVTVGGGIQVRDLLTGHLVAGAVPPEEPAVFLSSEELLVAGHFSDIEGLAVPSEHHILAWGVDDSLYFLSLPEDSFRYLAQQEPLDSKFVVSPDGKIFAYCFGGQLWSGEVDSLEPKAISTCGKGTQLAISNQWIAHTENTSLQTLDPRDGMVRTSFQGHAHYITVVEFSTDGSFLASGSRNTDFWLWSLDPPQGVMKILDVPNGVVSAAVSPDASLVAFSYGSKEGIPIRVLDVSSTRTLALITDGENGKLAAESLAFSPDSRILAAGDDNGNIYLFSRETWHVVAILSGHSGGITRLVFSQDGKNLISSSTDGTIRLWGIPAP